MDFGAFPIAHQYMDAVTDKRECYPFQLALCEDCNHVFIPNPISPSILYQNYVTLSDWKFQPHIPRLIELIQQYGVNKQATILEVGCNDGRFLKSLQEVGFTNLHGIEPASDACEMAKKKGIQVIQGFFNQDTADQFVQEKGKCDLFIIRQVLEHIHDLAEFSEAIKNVINADAVVLIEVPDFFPMLHTYDYTFWEEHVNYFTRKTLNDFISQIGIEEIHFERFLFSGVGQLLIGKCKSNHSSQKESPTSDYHLHENVVNYAHQWIDFKRSWQTFLSDLKRKGEKIAVYGAGCRTASLINFLDIAEYIDFVVDDQEEKQSLFMPGSRLEICASDRLHIDSISICLLGVNTENENKVIEKHNNSANKIIFYSILPPSERLPSFWQNWIGVGQSLDVSNLLCD